MSAVPHDSTFSPLPPPTRPVAWFSPRAAAANVAGTIVLLAPIVAVPAIVGSLFGPQGALVGLAVGSIIAAGFWFGSGAPDDRRRRRPSRQPVDPTPPVRRRHAPLCPGVDPPSRLYVTPERQPNTFATGRDPDHAAIVVTEGLLELLGPDELEAVLAHEVAHIGHRDVLFTSVAAGVAAAVNGIARLPRRLPFLRSAQGGGRVETLATPATAALLRLAMSRRREAHADDTGARLLGTGHPLAGALLKIDRAARAVALDVQPVQAATYIVNPLTGHPGRLARAHASHRHDRTGPQPDGRGLDAPPLTATAFANAPRVTAR